MKNRIIKLKDHKTCKEVLMSIYDDDNYQMVLRISAWHEYDGKNWYQEEDLLISDTLVNCFITDFSESSANAFADGMEF